MTAESPSVTGSQPQPVLSPLTSAAIFLVVTIAPGGEEKTREVLADLRSLERAFGFGVPEAALSCVAGIGSDAWDRLFDYPRPIGLHPFRPLKGSRHSAVATPETCSSTCVPPGSTCASGSPQRS